MLHSFEELHLGVYRGTPKEGQETSYLIKSAFMISLNYLVLYLLFMEYKIGYYIAFYTVLISVLVVVSRTIAFFQKKEKAFYGLMTSIPIGISGIYLFYLLVSYFMPTY